MNFSAVVHLPDNKGAFITGGCDIEDYFHKRVLFFEEYERFKISPSMVRQRAYHCAAYCHKRMEVYVFGGSQGIG